MQRKVKLFIASSLDGYIAREDGDVIWLFSDADYGYSQFFASIDTVLMGRKTYDKLLGFGIEYPYRGKKSYVFTRSAKWANDLNVEFVSEEAADFVQKLAGSKGEDIWVDGGSEIISALLNAGLIDEIVVSVHPVVLGRGMPLFKNMQRQIDLKLVKSIPYPSGLVQLHYEL